MGFKPFRIVLPTLVGFTGYGHESTPTLGTLENSWLMDVDSPKYGIIEGFDPSP